MANNKVVYDGATLIDLTSDTVTPETLLTGATAHDASGAHITGTATGGGDLSDVTLWVADFSTWDGTTVTEGDKDSDGREITA